MPGTALQSVGLLSLCLFVQLGLQFVYQLCLARWFGAGREMDAFQAVQAVPLVLSTILVGSLQYAFVPLFIQRKTRLGEQAAWDLANSTGLVLVPLVTVICTLGTLFAPQIIPVLVPDFDAPTRTLAIELFRIMIWLMWTICVTAYLQTLHQSAQVYRATAVAPVIGTLVTFAASAASITRGGIHAMAWSALAGALVTVLWQLPLWWRRWAWHCVWRNELELLWRGLWPIWAGAAVYKLDPLVDRYLASGYPPGSVSHLGYAGRLIAALLTLTTNGLAMVVFPVLAQHASTGNTDLLRRELQRALRLLVFLLLPLCAAVLWFSVPLVRDLFERGKFQPSDTTMVAALLVCHLGVLIGGSLGEILSKTIYAQGDTRSPTIIRSVGFAVGVVLKLWWGWTGGLLGLVWATSVSQLLIAGLDGVLVARRIGWGDWAALGQTLLRCGVGTLVAVVIGMLLVPVEYPGAALVAGSVAGLGYLATTIVLREEQALLLWQLLRRSR